MVQARQPAASGPSSLPAEMDVASIIATFPPELREEALMGFIGNEEVRCVCISRRLKPLHEAWRFLHTRAARLAGMRS